MGAALPVLAQEAPPSDGGTHGLSKRTFPHNIRSSEHRQGVSKPKPSPRIFRDPTGGGDAVARSDVAYAALLMDDHDRGIRTLGQSLIDSRTSADLVAILGVGVTQATEARMRAQGWRIRRLAADGPRGGGDGGVDVDSARGSVSTVIFVRCGSLPSFGREIMMMYGEEGRRAFCDCSERTVANGGSREKSASGTSYWLCLGRLGVGDVSP